MRFLICNFLVGIFCFFGGCKHNTITQILPLDSFKNIFQDLAKINIYDNIHYMYIANKDSLYWGQYQTVLKKYKINDSLFVHSFRHYFSDYNAYKNIMFDLKKNAIIDIDSLPQAR